MNNLQIPLSLPLAAVQYIVNVLMERPYKEAADLILAIKAQADEATKKSAEAPADTSAT